MNIENTFTSAELHQLADLIGTKYICLGSGQMSPWLQSDEVILTTDTGSVCLLAKVKDESFEGYDQTYSFISTSRARTARLKARETSGNVYRQFSGEQIQEIKVVTESVQMKSFILPEWKYTTSVALILILESGYIAISKLDHHNELLIVTFGSEFSLTDLPLIDHHFRDDFERKFVFSRTVTPLGSIRG